MSSVAQSRMTTEQAQAALSQVNQQITAHCDECPTCRAARYGQISRIWNSCAVGLQLFRTEQALSHRLNYLAMRTRRQARSKQAEEGN